MNKKVSRKITALIVSLCMMLSLMPAASAADTDYAAEITGVTIENSIVKSAEITVNTEGSYTAYAAVYENGALSEIDSAEVTASGTVNFTGGITFDAAAQELKCFVWDEYEPVSEVYEYEDVSDAYTVTFVTDDNSSITVSKTQDFTSGTTADAKTAYARDGSTGAVLTDGNGQLNFKVVTADGYSVKSVEIANTDTEIITDSYKNLKLPSELGEENTFRITKITGDITVTVNTQETQTLDNLADGVISAFRYNTDYAFTSSNTEGDAPATISGTFADGTTDIALNMFDYKDANKYVRSSLVLSSEDTADDKTPETADTWESAYVQVALSTVGYENLKISASIGATKKGAASYKLQYSTDGETFADVTDTNDDTVTGTLTTNKTLTQLFSEVSLPADAAECEMLYIRIVPTGTATVGGTAELTTGSGEFAVNDILIYGDRTATPTATPTTGDGIIHLNGTSIDAAGVENVTVDGSIVTITAAGEYEIEGTLTNGQIAVASTVNKEAVQITLDSVSVTSTTGSAFDAEGGKITLITETANTFETTAADAAAVYSKKDLTIQGGGSITANSDSGNGIHCKKDLTIKDVNVSVEAGNNGIKGNQSVKITKGADGKTIHVKAVKDGICSDQAPELDTAGTAIDTSFFDDGDTCGTVTINGGTIDITTTGTTKTGDGIQADQTVTIANNPNITITATGEAIKANFSQLDLADASNYSTYADTMASYNGCVNISGGTINATAGEDGIKAVKDVTVSGGSVTVTEAGDDGIQAGDVVINTATPSNSSRIDGTVTISGGEVDIKKAAGDGIVTTQTYAQSDGTVTIVSAKDGVQAGKAYTQYDISGSGNDETVLYETNGIVNITGGNLTITAAGGATRTIKDNDGNTTLTDIDYSCKGIKARKLIDISGGTLDINALDDAIHSNHTANISGGTITVQSCDDGVHGEYFLNISGTAYIDVQKSYEGIEGSKIYITGGETYVAATDDGANAAGDEPTDSAYTLSTVYGSNITQSSVTLMAGGFNGGSSSGGGWGGGPGMNDNSAKYGYMEVSGGLLYINADGDGFDSNGNGVIKGGVVLVNGPAAGQGGNGVFDIGDNNNTLTITGGTVIGIGTSGMPETPTSTTDSQAYVLLTPSSCNANTAIQVLSGSNEIVTYVSPKSYNWIFVSTGDIKSGSSYTVKYGGSVSGGTWAENYKETYGIKTGTTFSGGSSSNVTAVTGGSSSGSPGGPGQGGPGGGGR